MIFDALEPLRGNEGTAPSASEKFFTLQDQDEVTARRNARQEPLPRPNVLLRATLPSTHCGAGCHRVI